MWSKYHMAIELAERTGTMIGAEQPVVASRYQLLELIGSGQFGFVYRAQDIHLRREVAIKTINPQANWEAIALARVEHPNVVRLYDYGVSDGCGYLVMELLRGRTLAAWLASEPRSEREKIEAFSAAGRGLSAAHAAGLVHCDFKPENVMVCDDGRVVVLDFGIASAARVPPSRDGVGTLAYMSPEQLTGRAVTAAADQFSFCVAFWEAIVGGSPFRGGTVAARMESYIAGPDRDRRPRGTIGDVILRGLSLEPAIRWPTMQHLLTELARAERARSRRRPLLAAAAAVCSLALVIGLLPQGPTTTPAGARQLERAVNEIDVRSLCLVAIAAAEDGRGDDARAVLQVAEFRARGEREQRVLAVAADKVGLALFEHRLWDDALEAHAIARRHYQYCDEPDLEFRALELMRAVAETRARHL